MHPWSQTNTTTERKARRAEMKAWMQTNKHLCIKPGAKRADGKVFRSYSAVAKNGEYWTNQAVIDLCKERDRAAQRTTERKRASSEYSKARYASRPDIRAKQIERARAYQARFPEETAARITKYREDKARQAEIHARYRQKHPDRIAAIASRKRAIKASQLHPMHDKAIELKMHAEAKALRESTGIRHEVDHIIPLARGGLHHHLNLQVLPESVNRVKRANPFWTSTEYKDFRSVPQELWPEALMDFYLAMLSV